MSLLPASEPVCTHDGTASAVNLTIDARPRDIGGFSVRRLLPSSKRRLVGPFVFFDHMGPAAFAPGQGIDVRPHPHVNLATVTYLFDGEIVHRDSLGSHQAIRPGDINWMTAGSGIVHSERTSPELRRTGSKLHGLQIWVALPKAHEETDPEFHHHPAMTLPALELSGVHVRVLAGKAYGVESPVRALSPLFYADASLPVDGVLEVPGEHAERALYVVEGSVSCGADRAESGRMLVFRTGVPVTLRAHSESRVVVFGGAPIDGERHIYWNFVSSSEERLERAKRDWEDRRFPSIPGDDVEFIPLPK